MDYTIFYTKRQYSLVGKQAQNLACHGSRRIEQILYSVLSVHPHGLATWQVWAGDRGEQRSCLKFNQLDRIMNMVCPTLADQGGSWTWSAEPWAGRGENEHHSSGVRFSRSKTLSPNREGRIQYDETRRVIPLRYVAFFSNSRLTRAAYNRALGTLPKDKGWHFSFVLANNPAPPKTRSLIDTGG